MGETRVAESWVRVQLSQADSNEEVATVRSYGVVGSSPVEPSKQYKEVTTVRGSAFVSKLERYTRLFSGIGTIQAFSERRGTKQEGELMQKLERYMLPNKSETYGCTVRKAK